MRKRQLISPLFFLSASLWAPCPSQGQNIQPIATAVPSSNVGALDNENRCDVCGEGGTIGNPLVLVATPFGRLSCSALQGAAIAGAFDAETCQDIQSRAYERCACEGGTDPTTSVPVEPEPIPAPTNQPVGDEPTDPTEPIEPESFSCNICGEGKRVGNGARLVNAPQGRSSCGVLEVAGSLGSIPEAECPVIQDLVTVPCECTPGDPPTLPPAAAPAPVAPSDAYICPICGEGMVVTLPGAIVTLPSQTERTCMQLLDAAAAGNVLESQCSQLQQITTPCGCEPIAPTPAPVPTTDPESFPSDVPSFVPTQSPLEPGHTREPTAPPEITFDGCFDNLSDIYVLEKGQEDVSIRRRYVLCPGTRFDLGYVNDQNEVISGQRMIQLRPNVIYQCGDDGSRFNGCLLNGGDFGVASFYEVFEGVSETVENVLIQGLTFQSQQLFSVVLEAAGDITFEDCAFKKHSNMAPILLQWRGDGPPELETNHTRLLGESYGKDRFQAGTDTKFMHSVAKRSLEEDALKHSVTFKNCVFRDNFAIGDLAFPGVIENTFMSELTIVNCLFENNSYGSDGNNPAPFGYAVRSFGPLTIESSCFIGNTFRTFGSVQAYGTFEATDNYVSTDQTDLHCSFVALFESGNEQSFECINADSDKCGFTQPPTPSPTVNTNPDPTTMVPTTSPTTGTTSVEGTDGDATPATAGGQGSKSSSRTTYSGTVLTTLILSLLGPFVMG